MALQSSVPVLMRSIKALLPAVQDEIEQRQYSGNDECWRELDSLAGSVNRAVSGMGYKRLTGLQKMVLGLYDEDTGALAADLESLFEYEDPLLHFALAEAVDGDNECVAEAARRLGDAGEQLLALAARLEMFS